MIQVGDGINLGEAKTTGGIISTGIWYHIAYVFNGGGATNSDKLKIYFNGVEQSLTFSGTIPSTTSASNSAVVVIGSESIDPSITNVDGRIDEVRFWTTVRSQAEIQANMNLNVSPSSPNLLSYWNFNDGTAIDLTSNGNDGTLTNGATIVLDNDINSDSPLSVELNSFTARQIENSISLTWSTASEIENEGFNVYRKTGENNFIQIASHKSHRELKGQGNTSVETFYTFIDNSEHRSGELYTYYISDVETNGVETKHIDQAETVRFVVNGEVSQTKLDYVLAQNFPNPFNPSTTINFQIAKTQDVRLQVYNLKGELVKELVNEKMNKGTHSAKWDGTDSFGNQVSSGTYFYKISAGIFSQTNKMIFLK